MSARLLADAVLVLHLAFVLFVAAGVLAVARWRRLAWLHLPAVAWGVGISLTGTVCPLTPLEQWLRTRAGQQGYAGGFIEHYLLGIVYPEGLTRGLQIGIGIAALGLNLAAYAWFCVLRSRRG
jgi:hypothetical protein